MKINALLVLVAASLLASCTAARDERLQNTASDSAAVVHNTIVDCPVYDGMKKTSTVLAQMTTGNEVQVTDTINAYFVRVRLEKDGQTLTGYMDRRCFGERGSERGNRKVK